MAKFEKNLLFGGVFGTHTEKNEDGSVISPDKFHVRFYWDFLEDGVLAQIKGTKLSVLMVLLMHSDKNLRSFPSIKRISKLTAYSEESVSKAISELIEFGLVSRKQERSSNGTFKKNIYTLFPEAAAHQELQYYEEPDISLLESVNIQEPLANEKVAACKEESQFVPTTQIYEEVNDEITVVAAEINNDYLGQEVVISDEVHTALFGFSRQEQDLVEHCKNMATDREFFGEVAQFIGFNEWLLYVREALKVGKNPIDSLYNVYRHFIGKPIRNLIGALRYELNVGWNKAVSIFNKEKLKPLCQDSPKQEFTFYNWLAKPSC